MLRASREEVRRSIAELNSKIAIEKETIKQHEQEISSLEFQRTQIQDACSHPEMKPHGQYERVCLFSTCADCDKQFEN
jgi:hypothetical protein